MRVETTKQKILTEALKLFSQNGYEAVSVEQIANAVGIKAPSLYKHYKGKRDIFDHILEHMNEMDLERAKKYEMPEGDLDKIASAYCETPIEKTARKNISSIPAPIAMVHSKKVTVPITIPMTPDISIPISRTKSTSRPAIAVTNTVR